MTSEEFDTWVNFHLAATGGDDRAADALYANRPVVIGKSWNATLAELKQATQRLVVFRRTPRFPNEHLDAVGVELVRLREDAAAARRAEQARAEVRGCDCPACNGGVLLPRYAAALDRYRTFCASFGELPPRGNR